MTAPCCPRLRGIIAVALLLALLPSPGLAQDVAVVSTRDTAVPDSAGDSIEIVPSTKYQAGGLHRTLLGNGYRDLWATPLRVQVLDLATFGGGLRPLKESGGNQTKSLRFVTPDGTEYVFRSVAKDAVTFPPAFKGTVVQSIARDQVSSHFPVAGLVAAPILQAAGVLHVTPMLVVMPDDPRLGEFQSKFANRLGMIEEYPTVPEHAPGFAGAVEIIGSDSLLVLIDSSSGEQVDARALLAARLMDMLLNDWDRHPGPVDVGPHAAGPCRSMAPHRPRPGQGPHLLRRRPARDGAARESQPDELRQHVSECARAHLEQPPLRSPDALGSRQVCFRLGGGDPYAQGDRFGDRRGGAGPAGRVPVDPAADRADAQGAA